MTTFPRIGPFANPQRGFPASEETLEQLRTVASSFEGLEVNLHSHGLTGTSGNIDAALTSALAALTVLTGGPGVIVIPLGTWTVLNPPSFQNTRNIILKGMGGVTAGQSAGTQITYTGTGTRVFDCRSTFGFKARDFQCFYNQSGVMFQDGYFDFSHSAAALDSAHWVLENIHISGAGVRGGQKLVNLNKTIGGKLRDCHFAHSRVAVYGKIDDASYANGVSIENCTFISQTFQHIVNGGEAWTINDATLFEPLCDAAGAAAGAGAFTLETATFTKALAIEGCWFGDTVTGTWITGEFRGLTLKNNFLGGGLNCVSITGDSTGVVIVANDFVQTTNAIVINGTGNDAFLIVANTYETVINKVTLLTVPANSIIDPGGGPIRITASAGNQSLELDGFIDVTRAGTGNGVFRAFVTGEANERLILQPGLIKVGPGGAGPAPDTVLERAQARVWKMDAALQLQAIAAASVPNNTIFLDSADNVIKKKDNVGVVTAI